MGRGAMACVNRKGCHAVCANGEADADPVELRLTRRVKGGCEVRLGEALDGGPYEPTWNRDIVIDCNKRDGGPVDAVMVVSHTASVTCHIRTRA